MKFFVTVGTYKFDDLIEHLDETFKGQDHEVIFQIGQGTYFPKYFEFVSFTHKFDELTEWADIIITHAGAGTIYTLLKKNKNLVVVPNLKRVDTHQGEISKYVQMNKFAYQCQNVADFPKDLSEIIHFFETEKDEYTFEAFSKIIEITEYLQDK